MAETCIVCLGDLLVESELSSNSDVNDNRDGTSQEGSIRTTGNAIDVDDRIAHLLPCGHHLHNGCLKPWVERANSCPICRAPFNQVELKDTLYGTVVSSYGVQDKKQEVVFDNSEVIEDALFGVESSEPCLICESHLYGGEELLLLCDGCSSSCHVFCAGLDDAPAGTWFCHNCERDPRLMAESRRSSTAIEQRYRPAARRRHRRGNNVTWTRVWQSVWNHLNLDLDFPYDDDVENTSGRNEAIERAEVRQWQDRFRVAERQGAAHRFRETAPALLESPATRRRQTPDPGSQEELRAWNAFEKAKDLAASTSRRRKRRSATSSPIEPVIETERKLKRPRTRKDLTDASTEQTGDLPSATRVPSAAPIPSTAALATSPAAQARVESSNIGTSGSPSFLQSLLKEVETKSVQTEEALQHASPSAGPPAERPSSPYYSSQAASPTASKQATPDASTPPLSPMRPASPPPLSSVISPLYPPAPEFSPYSPAEPEPSRKSRALHKDLQRRRSGADQSPSRHQSPPRHADGGARSEDTSPTRSSTSMSYTTKAEIQKMVSAALKPMYRKALVNKEQYTEINRDVSRMLYEQVGDASRLAEANEREEWARVAVDEVENAVKALQPVVTDDVT